MLVAASVPTARLQATTGTNMHITVFLFKCYAAVMACGASTSAYGSSSTPEAASLPTARLQAAADRQHQMIVVPASTVLPNSSHGTSGLHFSRRV